MVVELVVVVLVVVVSSSIRSSSSRSSSCSSSSSSCNSSSSSTSWCGLQPGCRLGAVVAGLEQGVAAWVRMAAGWVAGGQPVGCRLRGS